jgi:LysR family transcriptional activator of nhaA
LISDLALFELDLVLTDAPVRASPNFHGYTRLLSDSGVGLFAEATLAKRLRERFPESLADVPVFLPLEHTGLRVALNRWFESHHVRPRIRGEFQDSALAVVFAREHQGVIASPTAIAEQMRSHYRLALVADLDGVRERFYAVTPERKVAHPAVRAIVRHDGARSHRS